MHTAAEIETGRAGGTGWRSGVVAGLLGAVAMMGFMVGAAALDGAIDALDPIRAVGTTLRGRDASPVGPGPVVWGIVVHLLVGAALGGLFALMFPRDLTAAQGAVLGGGGAIFWMALAVWVLMPRLAPGLHDRMPLQGGAWVIAHALFGAVAGLAPALRRQMARRSRRRARDAHTGVLHPRPT